MDGISWITEQGALLGRINDTVWQFAETGLQEMRSAKFLADVLEEHGFSITRGVAGMETAFVARYGTNGPEIGLLAEYDALPGLSQKATTAKETEEAQPDSGHGCGHNALAAAILGGAMGIKADIENGLVQGRITVFGCPAEELLIGKGKMAAEGLFDSCDVLLSCHPNDISYVWARTSTAVWSGTFTFYGKTAHAAIDPFNGRSALDAVELMDVGANYLREHVEPDVRLHYVITDGGQVPNVVPARASVWYTLRAGNQEQVEKLRKRVELLAQGAATMTETQLEENVISGCASILRNRVLERVLLEAMMETGAPEWTEKEFEFAEVLSGQLAAGQREKAIEDYQILPMEEKRGLHTSIYKGFYREGERMAVSTDVGDASWQVPTGVFSFASTVIGSPGHSWFYTACCGSSIAHKGVSMAAKVFVYAARSLFKDTKLIEKAREEFYIQRQGKTYKNIWEAEK